MGLELVEIVLNVEEAFGIRIEHAEMEQIQTVGDFHRLVLEKNRLIQGGSCASSHTFYQLRRVLMNRRGLKRESISPGSKLENLIPQSDRSSFWRQIQCDMKTRLPGLRRPSWVYGVIALAAVLCALLSTIILANDASPGLIFACSLALTAILYIATAPLAVYFPFHNIRSLVMHMLTKSPSGEFPLSERDIWGMLVVIISDNISTPPEDIHPHSRFIQDLNCG